MFKLDDEVVCVALPFAENMEDAPNARHHLTVGKTYRVVMINTNEITGQWLIVLRDDLKRGSYHHSIFRPVLDAEPVKAPLPSPQPLLEAAAMDGFDVMRKAQAG